MRVFLKKYYSCVAHWSKQKQFGNVFGIRLNLKQVSRLQKEFGVNVMIFKVVFFNYFSLCDFDLVQYSKTIHLNNNDELIFPTKGLFQSLLLLKALLGAWSNSNSASSCNSQEFNLQRVTLILYSLLSSHSFKIERFSYLKDECSN